MCLACTGALGIRPFERCLWFSAAQSFLVGIGPCRTIFNPKEFESHNNYF